MEAVGGGWGPSARGVWSELAKSSALASGELVSDTFCAEALLQRMSVILHRENARAALRRMTRMHVLLTPELSSVSATVAEEAADRAV